MSLRLPEADVEALRQRAAQERRSMQDVMKSALHEYVERHSRDELLEQVLDSELPRYADALRRLGE